ncbi:MAG TPA: NAD-dependent epimerase/dehydratase family protein [Rhodoglobus sp.]|nr:NAD-dependent epimerase/dehydratase family protein [Rhodoglobus sp.]
MARTALIIGGTGQIGRATAGLLELHGWDVTVAARTPAPDVLALDREDTDALLRAARGRDLVLDAVAYTPAHAAQLSRLAGEVGSLVVISTASVYADDEGRYLDVAGERGFPVYPVPVTEQQPTVEADAQTYSPLKAAMERVLLATEGLPVSILRPGAIHGPHTGFLREWFFIKRVLDGRPHTVLAFDGASRFDTSATANIAELARLCAERPGRRALNASDGVGPTVAEIGATVFAHLDHDAALVALPGPPREDGPGGSPWGVPSPFVQSMARARDDLGFEPVPYAETIGPAIDWMVDAVRGRDWTTAFPKYLDRYGAETWFPYDAEDEFVAGMRT